MRISRWLCTWRPTRAKGIRVEDTVRILCLLFVFLAGTPQTRASERGTVDVSLPAEAAAAIAANDWEQVLTLLEPLAKSDEPGESVHYWYGVALYHQDHCTMSLRNLNAALQLNPRALVTAHHIARVALAHPLLVEADDLQPALAAFPDDPLVLTAAGSVQHELATRRRRKPGKDDTVTWTHLDQARDYLARAIALDATNVTAHLEMVETLEKLEQWDRAIKHLLIADALEPLGHEAYVMLGQLYAEKGNHSAAADAYELAIELASSVPERVEWERGEALLNAGRSDEAVEVFRDLFNANNINRTVRFMLGRAAYDAGDYALALHCFRESHKVDHNADALAWSARCAYDMEQDELAVTLVNQAMDMRKQKWGEDSSPDALWHFVRGRALWQMGDKKAAMDDLAEASAKDKANREYATWAIHAARKLNDPFSVIQAAKNYGYGRTPGRRWKLSARFRKRGFGFRGARTIEAGYIAEA